MLDKMKELWEMKKKMDELKLQLDSIILESEDQLVSVKISGSQEIKSVLIKGELGGMNKTKLEASITDTVNRAVKQAQKSAAEKMGSMQGFKIPGL